MEPSRECYTCRVTETRTGKKKTPPQVRGRLRLEWRGRAAHEDGTSLRLQDAEAVVQHCEMNVEAIGLEVPRDEPGAFEAIAGPGGDRELRDDPVSYTHLRAHETRHDLVCR